MAGTHVMANISSGDSPESFLVDYFREQAPTSVRRASGAVRVSDDSADRHAARLAGAGRQRSAQHLLDALRYRGLVQRAVSEVRSSPGRANGRVVRGAHGGRSSGRPVDGPDWTAGKAAGVDGFAHKRHMQAWPELMAAAVEWAGERGAALCRAVISIEDEDKQAAFEGLGFSRVGPGTPFEIGGRQVRSVVMDRPTG